MAETAVTAAVIAACAAIVGTAFSLYLGFRFNRTLEEIKWQLGLDSQVRRLKFEKEFQVLQQIWGCLVALRNAGEAFTPGFKSGFPDELECRRDFAQAYLEFLRTINLQKPFFPQEVFCILDNYRRAQHKYFVGHQFISRQDFSHEWVSEEFWEKRDEQIKKVEQLAEDVCEAIRTRAA